MPDVTSKLNCRSVISNLQRTIPLLCISLLLPFFAASQTFNHQIYELTSSSYDRFLRENWQRLYDENENERESQFEALKNASRQSIKEGDSLFSFQILTDFIISEMSPEDVVSDEVYQKRLIRLRMSALDFLIDQTENDSIGTTNQEFLVESLARIGTNESLPEFEFNEKAIEAILQIYDDFDDLVIKQAVVFGVKDLILKGGRHWDDLRESSARIVVSALDSKNIELKRVAMFTSLDILERATELNDGTKRMWVGVIDAVDELRSPELKADVRSRSEAVIKAHSGSLFKRYVEDFADEIDDIELERKRIREPISELIEILTESDDCVEIESIIAILLNEAKKDRAILNTIYAKISAVTLIPDISEYKLRLLNQALITMTDNANSSLYFFRTAMSFLGEISLYRDSHKANVPINMLAALLATTDYEGLSVPTIQEIKVSLDSELPFWIGKRLINLIYVQAGESPNENVALYSVKGLDELSRNAKCAALRWEAASRIRLLTKNAKMDSVREFALTWN